MGGGHERVGQRDEGLPVRQGQRAWVAPSVQSLRPLRPPRAGPTLPRFRGAGGEDSLLVPLQHGRCLVVGALLDEDRASAARTAAAVTGSPRDYAPAASPRASTRCSSSCPDRPGNQQIVRRLSNSPRTVEKHMASLLAKTAAGPLSPL